MKLDNPLISVAELHTIGQDSLQYNRTQYRPYVEKGELYNFEVGYLVLVARQDFTSGD